MARNATLHLPPGIGVLVQEPLLFNPYQDAFQTARRMRKCLACNLVGAMDANGVFRCERCQLVHANNLTAPRVYDRFLLLTGRGGGKTLIGAHAIREELMIPNALVWVMSDTFKRLHDSTFPTLVGLIPPEWVRKWDPEHMEIILLNNAKVAFRSLEDPERARGPHGVTAGWFDEAAQCPERAYDVFEPTLIKAGGIIICTTTVYGYDWTYEKIEQRAGTEPGYWMIRYWTEENPLFASNPQMRRQIERAKRTMSPEFYAQEYRAERRNAQGSVYEYAKWEAQCLDDDQMKTVIPEWPAIDPERPVAIGLDSGADHPFGAVKAVMTPKGLVWVDEYLQRMKSFAEHRKEICRKFGVVPGQDVRWSANKNEAQLRLEFGVENIGVIPVDAKHNVGIQRVHAWLHTKRMWFAKSRVPKLIEQMKAYRYAVNTSLDGSKKQEAVFKLQDELPDGVRYVVMAWPELPDVTPVAEQRRDLSAMSARTRYEIDKMREMTARQEKRELNPGDQGYPIGDFWGGAEDTSGGHGAAEAFWN